MDGGVILLKEGVARELIEVTVTLLGVLVFIVSAFRMHPASAYLTLRSKTGPTTFISVL